MKILVATDGSKSANDAHMDLLRAGLPENVDATVLSIADVWLPSETQGKTNLPSELGTVAKQARAKAEQERDRALGIASAAAQNLSKLFPSWKLTSKSAADSPAWGIVKYADEWKADLVVVGSQGLTGLGQMLQGSVSQKVVTHSPYTVRVGRDQNRKRKEIRLIAAFDGSTQSTRAIDWIANRNWSGTEQIRIISVLDFRLSTAPLSYLPTAAHWIEQGYHNEEEWIRNAVKEQAEKLSRAGLNVTTSIIEGNPKRDLLAASQQWEADCIFVGARGLTGVERFLMGSVSGAIVAQADCSVEVIRK